MSEFIQPSGYTIRLVIGPMTKGLEYYVARYVNGHLQEWWNNWPLNTILFVYSGWEAFERKIKSKETRNE